MNPPISDLAFALAASQSGGACLFLMFWLWSHRMVRIPAYAGPRRHRAGLKAATASRHPRAKPDWVVQKIIYLAAHLRTCRKVEAAFDRQFGRQASARKTYIAQVIRDHAEQIQQRRREIQRRKPLLIPVGHTWALDLTLFGSPYGTTFTVLAILDAGSRKLLRCVVMPRKCVWAIMAHVLLAASESGLPDAIRTDNEAMFTSRAGLAMFKAMSIRARRGPPLQPWHNGRIERFWGTLKAALQAGVFATPQVLQAALDEFTRFYNIARPHQGLAGLTPEEVWQGKTMADVQLAHAQGCCDQALNE